MSRSASITSLARAAGSALLTATVDLSAGGLDRPSRPVSLAASTVDRERLLELAVAQELDRLIRRA